MKDSKKGKLAMKSMRGKSDAGDESVTLVDKQPQTPLVEVVPKSEKLRHVDVDVNHRFGKSSGSN